MTVLDEIRDLLADISINMQTIGNFSVSRSKGSSPDDEGKGRHKKLEGALGVIKDIAPTGSIGGTFGNIASVMGGLVSKLGTFGLVTTGLAAGFTALTVGTFKFGEALVSSGFELAALSTTMAYAKGVANVRELSRNIITANGTASGTASLSNEIQNLKDQINPIWISVKNWLMGWTEYFISGMANFLRDLKDWWKPPTPAERAAREAAKRNPPLLPAEELFDSVRRNRQVPMFDF